MAFARPFRGGGVAEAPPSAAPRYVVLGTPNTSGAMGALYGCIFHGSRSGRPEFSRSRGDGSEGERTLSYVRTPGTTSYNWLIDYDGTIYELAGWDLQAWHAGFDAKINPLLHLNTNWYGIAFSQVDTWEPLTDAQYVAAKWLLGEVGRRAAIPLRRIPFLSSRYAAKGITQHMDTAQGQSGGKSDVGPLLSWERLGL